jgi:tetratricopeptide (TPR) repeat protein
MNTLEVLVIDHSHSAADELEQILNVIGCKNVQTADSANDAWLLMRIKDFSCVISAWEMPDMSGLALLRIVRNDDRLHRTPFFLTDSAFTRIKVLQAGQAGVTGLFVKPFNAKSIEKKIRELSEISHEPMYSEAEDTYAEGMRYIEENDYENALKLFKRLTQKGESAEVYYNIGYIKTAQGLYEEAVAAFQKATQLDRLFAKAYEAMGRVYKYLGRTEKAQECFQKAADIYIGREKIQDAEEVLNEILAINPDSVNVFNSLGVLYRKKGDLKTALSQYHKALKVHPNEPHIYYNIGRLYFDMKQTEEARSFFENALKLDPHFQDARDVLNAMELGSM